MKNPLKRKKKQADDENIDKRTIKEEEATTDIPEEPEITAEEEIEEAMKSVGEESASDTYKDVLSSDEEQYADRHAVMTAKQAYATAKYESYIKVTMGLTGISELEIFLIPTAKQKSLSVSINGRGREDGTKILTATYDEQKREVSEMAKILKGGT